MKHHRLPKTAVPLITLLVVASGCDKQSQVQQAPPPMEVLVADVVVRDVPIIGEWVGETRGKADIEIRARVQGFLQGIHFREGGQVKKGQLLYTIDKSELLQELTAAQASLAAAQTELAYAESDVARYKPLAEINAVSQRDLDSAVAKRDAAVSQVEAAEALLGLTQINLSYSEIKAPIEGLIGLSKAKVGDYVGQNPNPVVLNTVSETDPIHVRFPVGEREYLELARRNPDPDRDQKPGSEDRRVPLELILADGTLHPHEGFTKFVERNIDASTGTLMIEGAFPNPDFVLRPGQYGRVRAVIDELTDARLIPQRAVQELQGRFQVWVVNGSSVELRNVVMGRRVDYLWVVEEGLEPGETVVVDGIQKLRADVTVAPEPWEPPSMPQEAVTGS